MVESSIEVRPPASPDAPYVEFTVSDVVHLLDASEAAILVGADE